MAVPKAGEVYCADDGTVSVVLDDTHDPNYEPSTEELAQYAEWLGIDPSTEGGLMWIAREGLRAPLPKEWKPCKTDTGDVYYFNFSTGDSIWDHPLDEHYKSKVTQERLKLGLPSRSNASGGTEKGVKKKKKTATKGLSDAQRADDDDDDDGIEEGGGRSGGRASRKGKKGGGSRQGAADSQATPPTTSSQSQLSSASSSAQALGLPKQLPRVGRLGALGSDSAAAAKPDISDILPAPTVAKNPIVVPGSSNQFGLSGAGSPAGSVFSQRGMLGGGTGGGSSIITGPSASASSSVATVGVFPDAAADEERKLRATLAQEHDAVIEGLRRKCDEQVREATQAQEQQRQRLQSELDASVREAAEDAERATSRRTKRELSLFEDSLEKQLVDLRRTLQQQQAILNDEVEAGRRTTAAEVASRQRWADGEVARQVALRQRETEERWSAEKANLELSTESQVRDVLNQATSRAQAARAAETERQQSRWRQLVAHQQLELSELKDSLSKALDDERSTDGTPGNAIQTDPKVAAFEAECNSAIEREKSALERQLTALRERLEEDWAAATTETASLIATERQQQQPTSPPGGHDDDNNDVSRAENDDAERQLEAVKGAVINERIQKERAFAAETEALVEKAKADARRRAQSATLKKQSDRDAERRRDASELQKRDLLAIDRQHHAEMAALSAKRQSAVSSAAGNDVITTATTATGAAVSGDALLRQPSLGQRQEEWLTAERSRRRDAQRQILASFDAQKQQLLRRRLDTAATIPATLAAADDSAAFDEAVSRETASARADAEAANQRALAHLERQLASEEAKALREHRDKAEADMQRRLRSLSEQQNAKVASMNATQLSPPSKAALGVGHTSRSSSRPNSDARSDQLLKSMVSRRVESETTALEQTQRLFEESLKQQLTALEWQLSHPPPPPPLLPPRPAPAAPLNALATHDDAASSMRRQSTALSIDSPLCGTLSSPLDPAAVHGPTTTLMNTSPCLLLPPRPSSVASAQLNAILLRGNSDHLAATDRMSDSQGQRGNMASSARGEGEGFGEGRSQLRRELAMNAVPAGGGGGSRTASAMSSPARPPPSQMSTATLRFPTAVYEELLTAKERVRSQKAAIRKEQAALEIARMEWKSDVKHAQRQRDRASLTLLQRAKDVLEDQARSLNTRTLRVKEASRRLRAREAELAAALSPSAVVVGHPRRTDSAERTVYPTGRGIHGGGGDDATRRSLRFAASSTTTAAAVTGCDEAEDEEAEDTTIPSCARPSCAVVGEDVVGGGRRQGEGAARGGPGGVTMVGALQQLFAKFEAVEDTLRRQQRVAPGTADEARRDVNEAEDRSPPRRRSDRLHPQGVHNPRSGHPTQPQPQQQQRIRHYTFAPTRTMLDDPDVQRAGAGAGGGGGGGGAAGGNDRRRSHDGISTSSRDHRQDPPRAAERQRPARRRQDEEGGPVESSGGGGNDHRGRLPPSSGMPSTTNTGVIGEKVTSWIDTLQPERVGDGALGSRRL